MRNLDIQPVLSREQLEESRLWLESFNHSIPRNPVGRFHTFRNEEKKLLAVTQQTTLAILVPAVNPDVVTPRETAEVVKVFHAWSANHDGGLNVAVPNDSHMHEYMAKLGYRPKCVIYEATP